MAPRALANLLFLGKQAAAFVLRAVRNSGSIPKPEGILSYRSQYGAQDEGRGLFPQEQEIRERLGAIARFYGNLIGTNPASLSW